MVLCRLGKAAEEGMGYIWFGSKLWMELACHKPRMIWDLDDLNQISLWVDATYFETGLF
jgi:hypothetical protein